MDRSEANSVGDDLRTRLRDPSDGPTVTEPLIYIDLGVGGMTCDDCVVHVTRSLQSVPGVKRAKVDLETRSAVVEAADDVTAAALGAAVRATGQYNAFERGRRSA